MWETSKTLKNPAPHYIYEPRPYLISNTCDGKKVIRESDIRTLPLWFLIDHTIAVVWALNNRYAKRKQLNVEQLGCTQAFLALVSKDIEDPSEVTICQSQIQDLSFELSRNTLEKESIRYDDIKTPEEKKINKTKCLEKDESDDSPNGCEYELPKNTDTCQEDTENEFTKNPDEDNSEIVLTSDSYNQISVTAQEIRELKKIFDVTLEGMKITFESDPATNKAYFLDILMKCRSNKVKRIENELKHLHLLEKFIKIVDEKTIDSFNNPDTFAKIMRLAEGRE